jgi:hypothetical protein
MMWIQDIYTFFKTFFEVLTFRTRPEFNSLNDIENPEDYEFFILNDNNRMDR